MKVLSKFVFSVCLLLIVGCAAMIPPPTPPEPPKGVFKTVRDIVVTPVNLDSNPDPSLNITKNQTIAIMTFKEPAGSGAGTLVADFFILDLQRKGYKVVEREHIEKIMKEQGLIGEGKTSLSDIEIAKKVGRLLAADYFVVGAVTEYRSENREIPLPKFYPESELARYESEYKKYNEDCRAQRILGVICFHQAAAPKTYREGEGGYMQFQNKREFARVANVGLTAKMFKIDTGKILWVGQASVTDEKLQDGLKRIRESMSKDFLKLNNH